jgi:hypothetical protein
MWICDVVVEYLYLINELKVHISREMHRYSIPTQVVGRGSNRYGHSWQFTYP